MGLEINLPQPVEIVTACLEAFVKHHAKCPPGKHVERPAVSPAEWLGGRDTGISSKTIYAVMTGTPQSWYDVPHDPADFGRCYRLLKLFPAWRERMPEVAIKFPKWEKLVRAWDELTALYEEELGNESGMAPKLWERMQELRRG